MTTPTPTRSKPKADLRRATEFIWRSARLVDRARFAHLFLKGEPNDVLAAVRAYQTPDGGFGHALEPDMRDPNAQPGAVRMALDILGQCGLVSDPMVARACDYLQTIATAEGGIPFALPSALRYPRAPWWQPSERAEASVIFTALTAAGLHEHRARHPWRDRASEYCWRELARFDPPDYRREPWDFRRIGAGYEARAIVAFLHHVDDPRRADALARMRGLVIDRGLVEPTTTVREAHTPLDYAPTPTSAARAWFADDVVDAHLGALVARQQDDGGFTFGWTDWNPATAIEWRGSLTVDFCRVLQAYDRLT